jgi:TfoX/Sxy family transcriptional regulator of competence genes
MGYDPQLADRARKATATFEGVVEKSMFGGLAFLLAGRMFCGVVDDKLMVRVGPADHEKALREPHAGPMDFTGRSMKGYVFVGPDGCRTQRAVQRWVARGAEFAGSLGPKTDPRRRRRRSSTTRRP